LYCKVKLFEVPTSGPSRTRKCFGSVLTVGIIFAVLFYATNYQDPTYQ
jgi:hypothetical protein